MWSAVTTDFARTDGWRNVAGETIVPSRIRSVTAREPRERRPRVQRAAFARPIEREVVVGAEEAVEPERLAGASEREPLLPRHPFLPLDHHADLHAILLVGPQPDPSPTSGSAP